MRPGGAKMAPGRHKMDARWLPEASRGAQAGPRWSQKGPNGGEMAPQPVNMLLKLVSNSFEDLLKN